MYLLRYVDSSAFEKPLITIDIPLASRSAVRFLSHPDAPDMILEQPGQAIALAALDRVPIQLRVTPQRAGGSIDARIDIESFDHRRPDAAKAAVDMVNLKSLTLLAHVARQGDILAPSGVWIGGPTAPSPIEGFELRPEPGDAQFARAQVLTMGRLDWEPWAPATAFQGSRGRATPLAGLRLELQGHYRQRYEFEGEALFLGTAPQAFRGAAIEARAPSGRDPLVGLRLRLRDKNGQLKPSSSDWVREGASNAKDNGQIDTVSKVRVFRMTSEGR